MNTLKLYQRRGGCCGFWLEEHLRPPPHAKSVTIQMPFEFELETSWHKVKDHIEKVVGIFGDNGHSFDYVVNRLTEVGLLDQRWRIAV